MDDLEVSQCLEAIIPALRANCIHGERSVQRNFLRVAQEAARSTSAASRKRVRIEFPRSGAARRGLTGGDGLGLQARRLQRPRRCFPARCPGRTSLPAAARWVRRWRVATGSYTVGDKVANRVGGWVAGGGCVWARVCACGRGAGALCAAGERARRCPGSSASSPGRPPASP